MSDRLGTIFDKVQDKKDEHAIIDGVNSFFDFNTPEKLKTMLPTKTHLNKREIAAHNQMLYMSQFFKEHYGMDLTNAMDNMVIQKELRNVALERKGRDEAFSVYAMREILRNARQSIRGLLNRGADGGA